MTPGACHHPLTHMHSATPARRGGLVYVVCGWQGCAARRAVRQTTWETRAMAQGRQGQPRDERGRAAVG